LTQFVDDNSKLITSLAAFIALTVFSAQIKDSEVQASLSSATLLGAILLTLELVTRTPARPRQWRLEAFQGVVLMILANVGWYWFKSFPFIWVLALSVIQVTLIYVLTATFAHLFGLAVKLFTIRLLHRDVTHEQFLRLSRFARTLFVVVVFWGLIWVLFKGQDWALTKLNQHAFSIKLPIH
jgi:hypothetical protein